MKIILQPSLPKNTHTVVPLVTPHQKLPKDIEGILKLHIKNRNLEDKEGASLVTHLVSGKNIRTLLVFHLGKAEELNHKKARDAAANLTKIIKSKKLKKVGVLMPKELKAFLQAFSEGMKLTDYHPAIHKTGSERKSILESEIEEALLINPGWNKNDHFTVTEVITTCRAVKTTRDFVNNPPNIVSTLTFVKEAKEIAQENKYRISVLGKKAIQKLKMGAFLAVNAGSTHPAHLVIMEHNAKKKEDPIILVGKGLIFDTGGINLKPTGYIEDMQLDMAGGAVVLGIFRVLKKLDIARRIIGIVPVTDNSIGQDATKPSEIVTAYNGKTIEIMNTDAEGRLILADALSYAVDKWKPKYIIDFATLTGACMVALGHHYAGLFGQDADLIQKLKEAGEQTDEGANPMPISDADKTAVKGQIADLTNAPASRYAGAGKAAAFLQHFVKDNTKWAHVDIAGTAWTKEPKPYETNFATGYGIRLMVHFLKNLS